MLHSVEIGSATACYIAYFPEEEKAHGIVISVFQTAYYLLLIIILLLLLLATIVTVYSSHIFKMRTVQNF
jgi:hypothetical protein